MLRVEDVGVVGEPQTSRANMAHVRQSRPNSGLVFHVESPKPVQLFHLCVEADLVESRSRRAEAALDIIDVRVVGEHGRALLELCFGNRQPGTQIFTKKRFHLRTRAAPAKSKLVQNSHTFWVR